MSMFIFLAICFAALALILLIRLFGGPSAADRALTDMALVLFALYSGRSIYLDIALVTAVLGFIGSVLIGRYLEGKL